MRQGGRPVPTHYVAFLPFKDPRTSNHLPHFARGPCTLTRTQLPRAAPLELFVVPTSNESPRRRSPPKTTQRPSRPTAGRNGSQRLNTATNTRPLVSDEYGPPARRGFRVARQRGDGIVLCVAVSSCRTTPRGSDKTLHG